MKKAVYGLIIALLLTSIVLARPVYIIEHRVTNNITVNGSSGNGTFDTSANYNLTGDWNWSEPLHYNTSQSTTGDSATAIGFLFNTPAYTDVDGAFGPKLFEYQNDGTTAAFLNSEGGLRLLGSEASVVIGNTDPSASENVVMQGAATLTGKQTVTKSGLSFALNQEPNSSSTQTGITTLGMNLNSIDPASNAYTSNLGDQVGIKFTFTNSRDAGHTSGAYGIYNYLYFPTDLASGTHILNSFGERFLLGVGGDYQDPMYSGGGFLRLQTPLGTLGTGSRIRRYYPLGQIYDQKASSGFGDLENDLLLVESQSTNDARDSNIRFEGTSGVDQPGISWGSRNNGAYLKGDESGLYLKEGYPTSNTDYDLKVNSTLLHSTVNAQFDQDVNISGTLTVDSCFNSTGTSCFGDIAEYMHTRYSYLHTSCTEGYWEEFMKEANIVEVRMENITYPNCWQEKVGDVVQEVCQEYTDTVVANETITPLQETWKVWHPPSCTFTGDLEATMGDVVCGDPDYPLAISYCRNKYDKAVVGVINFNATIILGKFGVSGIYPVVLAGNAPVRVKCEGIEKYDSLAAEGNSLRAIKANFADAPDWQTAAEYAATAVIGKALEPCDEGGTKVIRAWI